MLASIPARTLNPIRSRWGIPRFSLFGKCSKGIDPLYVGELVREGIENDWPYIFTDNEFEPLIDDRFAAIKQGFDRIRGREPRH
jgi:hypothetical protein